MKAYETDAEDVIVVTLSSKLSGSYNSALLGKNLYEEEIGEKNIQYICAGYGDQYDRYREFLDKQTVLTENSAGKIFRVTAAPSETE